AQPAGNRSGVELRFDDDVSADQVQGSGEAQHGGQFGLAGGHLGDRDSAQFVLDSRGHRHRCAPPPDPPERSGTSIASRIAALNRAASCRSALSSVASLETTRRAPIPLTCRASCSGSSTDPASATTTSILSPPYGAA